MQRKWLVLASLYLDFSTERFSDGNVRAPAYLFEGRVVSWGTIDRSIPVLPGLPTISDAKIRLADKDRKFRNILSRFSVETPLRKILELKIVREGDPESSAKFLYSGEVVDFSIGPAYVEFDIRDRHFGFLDIELDPLIRQEVFSYVSETDEGGFLPIIVGNCVTPATAVETAPLGQVPCPHMGFPSGRDGGDRFGLARHPITALVAVYRRALITVDDESVSEWVLVDPSEYTVQTETLTVGLVTYNPTYIDFFANQPEHTEIRADVLGINFRGAWGPLPAVSSPNEGDAISSFADFFISEMFEFFQQAGISESVFNTAKIAALWETFNVNGLRCEGVIAKVITARDFISWFTTSSMTDFFEDNTGLLTLNLTDPDPDPFAPEIKEGYMILRESFFENAPDIVANQVVYKYVQNAADNFYASWKTADNLADQFVIGFTDESGARIRREVKETVELPFVRDDATAALVASQRLRWQGLGSFRQQFQIPLHLALDFDLGQMVLLSHSQGLAEGGYDKKEAKIVGMTHDIGRMTTTIKTAMRVEIEVSAPEPPVVTPGPEPTPGPTPEPSPEPLEILSDAPPTPVYGGP